MHRLLDRLCVLQERIQGATRQLRRTLARVLTTFPWHAGCH